MPQRWFVDTITRSGAVGIRAIFDNADDAWRMAAAFIAGGTHVECYAL